MKKAASSDIWKKLMVLGEKQGSIKLKDLAQEMQLGPEETLGFLRQVFPAGTGLEIYHKDSECWVDIRSEAIQYMLPLSPAEWIQLHQILSQYKCVETPVTYSLKKKVTDSGPIKVVMELLNQLEVWDQELTEIQQKMVKDMEEAIDQKHLLTLSTHEEKHYVVHPCKVLHLEGQLSLIAEDYQDHCLIIVPMKDIQSFENVQSSSEPKVTPFEVEEFITAIRAMNEKETRLILKIHDPGSTNLFPDHHFLGKPCMITNPNGDLIWAAYVEPCEALYEWLMTLGKKVEILDPMKFKEEYLMYCEEKLRKIA
ncbi:MAG: WYL domain-containing protein [Bacteriovoracia bacterium]